jgi:hypothetical protein
MERAQNDREVATLFFASSVWGPRAIGVEGAELGAERR